MELLTGLKRNHIKKKRSYKILSKEYLGEKSIHLKLPPQEICTDERCSQVYFDTTNITGLSHHGREILAPGPCNLASVSLVSTGVSTEIGYWGNTDVGTGVGISIGIGVSMSVDMWVVVG